MTKNSLNESIQRKDAKICVIGLGQVGLPTALTFCKAGFTVIGSDIDNKLLSTINSKKSPFEEPGLDDLLQRCINSQKFATTDQVGEAVKNSDVIIVCVATPLTDDIRPNLLYLEKACISISEFSLLNKLVVIESSIPPGTFEELVIPILTKKNKLGSEFWIVFVPERLAPGQAFTDIQNTPRVIGFIDENSGIIAKALYEKIVNAEILLTSVRIAEISKLVENTFRDVNVALANEVGIICESYGTDVDELIRVCNSHPRVKLLQPGPGVGGPCLPKDPYLLLNPQGKQPISSRIILDSRSINDSMPDHVVNLIKESLGIQNKMLTGTSILVLGVAYKANVSDTRLSPAKEVICQLIKNGSVVRVFDPNTTESFGGETVSEIWKALSMSDVLVVLTDHDVFKKLNLKQIQQTMKRNPIIVDTRRIFNRKEAEDLGIQYVAVGYAGKIKT
ncbi:MAG: nucleotide sugar dehydrogenase [Thaumarchaeota archaeon]|nr:MAG: nucleotide sugar dehydrogenase [Nitrososphaerota archaeon]